jgi:4,5-dihydroxyphthalate decarboxylase
MSSHIDFYLSNYILSIILPKPDLRKKDASMAKLPLTIACGPYDRMGGIADGRVQIEGIEPTYVSIKSGPEIFARMIKNKEFDVSEMSASTYMSARARGGFPFVAIPVFPSKAFRHSFIFINKKSDVQRPTDLMGRRVGMMGYGQTAAVWIRGMLQEDFGLDLRKVHWLEGGSDAPYVAGKNIKVPEGLNIEVIPDNIAMSDLLASGKIDAMFGARHPASFGKNPDVVRLFPNYREVERDYFRRTGIFPIMHTIVICEELYERQRWIAASLYKAFVEAKQLADRDMRFSGAMRYALPWLAHDIDEIDELFGGDPFCYGVEANRRSLTALARYLQDQGFIDRPIDVDAIFAPVISDHT